MGADFHCFKYKIEPKWEDPICANGGKWTMTFPRGKSDTSWLYTVLLALRIFDVKTLRALISLFDVGFVI